MLAGSKASTNIVYNALSQEFEVTKVIIEERVSRYRFLKRRVRRLGIFTVIGQLLFRVMVVPSLKLSSRRRLLQLTEEFGLDNGTIDESKIIFIASVNAKETKALLKEANPDIVVVNGTRIIANEILDSIPARFINMHDGITPLYRGVHGAYWALVNGNQWACGVTVHVVDSGIDTGNVLQQGLIKPTNEDSFVTYPLLQLGAGIPLLKSAIRDLLADRIEFKPPPKGQSKLWSHPTLLQYLSHRLSHGVK